MNSSFITTTRSTKSIICPFVILVTFVIYFAQCTTDTSLRVFPILDQDTPTRVVIGPSTPTKLTFDNDSSITAATTEPQVFLQIDFTNRQPPTAPCQLFVDIEPCSGEKSVTMVVGVNSIPSLSSYTSQLAITSRMATVTLAYNQAMTVYIGLFNNDTRTGASVRLTARLKPLTSLVDAKYSQFSVSLVQLDDVVYNLKQKYDGLFHGQQRGQIRSTAGQVSPKIQVKVRWHAPNDYSLIGNLRYKIAYSLPSTRSQDTNNRCQMGSVCGIDTCAIQLTTNYQQFPVNTSTMYYEQVFEILGTAAVENADDFVFNIATRDVTDPSRVGIYAVHDSKQSFLGRYIFIALLVAIPIVVIVSVAALIITCYCFSLNRHRGYYNVVY